MVTADALAASAHAYYLVEVDEARIEAGANLQVTLQVDANGPAPTMRAAFEEMPWVFGPARVPPRSKFAETTPRRTRSPGSHEGSP